MAVGRASLALPVLLGLIGCVREPPACSERNQAVWFVDDDGDGFGDPQRFILACEAFEGFVRNEADCDDTDGTVFPFAVELCDDIDNDCDLATDEGYPFVSYYLDADGDGFGWSWDRVVSCTPLPGRVTVLGDCDDTRAGVNPDAEEVCNLRDDDCDGAIDDQDDSLADGEGQIWYLDGDGDGFANPDAPLLSCLQPIGSSATGTDCNDADPLINPLAHEVCDGIDNDCDRLTDDSDPSIDPLTQRTWFVDVDQDGLGDPFTFLLTCTEPWYWVLNGDDCNDDEAAIGRVIDTRWRFDADGDGVGGGLPSSARCDAPGPDWALMSLGLDCDDSDPSRSPLLPEGCDGIDNDCDGAVDDADLSLDPDLALTFFVDADGDGVGGEPTVACLEPAGSVAVSGDCDDQDPNVFPGALEVCNTRDDDCDGLLDDADPDRDAADGMTVFLDADGDGFGDPFTNLRFCEPPVGWVAQSGDCDDGNAMLGVPALWWLDADGDRFGDGELVGPSCVPPDPRFVLEGVVDCDDTDPVVKPGAFETCDDGVDQDCDGLDALCPMPSCSHILASGNSQGDGTYAIDPTGSGTVRDVWCDMTTDGGGWTLVSSSTWPVDDAEDVYSDTLADLFPQVEMAGVWSGMRPVIPYLSDLRFACRELEDDPSFEVDLVFYDTHWYRELTAGPENSVCFNQDDGAGYDPPPERLDVLTGSIREAGNHWNASGYLEGEDLCDAPDDFTVDFDNRGMDGNQSDGTDWGEDDGLRKCGRTNRGVSWFIFVR